MAKVNVTAAAVAVLYPQKAQIFDRIAAEQVAPGDTVYLNTNGKAAKANAGAAGTLAQTATVLTPARAGQGVSVLKSGHVAGFDVSGLAYGAALYASNTAGEVADAAGTVSKVIGHVEAVAVTDGPQKVVYVEHTW